MAASTGSKIASLVLRIVTFVLLFISLLILATNTQTLELDVGSVKLRFNDVSAYRYMLASIILGALYSLFQIAFSLYHVIMKGDGFVYLDFYGDKLLSYLLATGSAAGFGVTRDLKSVFDDLVGLPFTTFYEKAYASASLLLLAFLCAAALSILSSLALPKSI